MEFPKSETIENECDKKIWWWKECIEDAIESGLKMASNEFWVYYKLRVYETHGRYGFSVASVERLAEDTGLTVDQVMNALRELREKGIIFHIVCDKRVYRNRTKIDVTNRWCEERGLDVTKFIAGNRSLDGIPQLGEVTKTEQKPNKAVGESTEAVGESTGSVGESTAFPLMNKYKEQVKMNNADNDKRNELNAAFIFPKLFSKFKRAGIEVVNKKQAKEKLESLLTMFREEETNISEERIFDAADNYIDGNWESKSLQHFLSPNVFPYCLKNKVSQSSSIVKMGGYN